MTSTKSPPSKSDTALYNLGVSPSKPGDLLFLDSAMASSTSDSVTSLTSSSACSGVSSSNPCKKKSKSEKSGSKGESPSSSAVLWKPCNKLVKNVTASSTT